jgi:hypothetical protein
MVGLMLGCTAKKQIVNEKCEIWKIRKEKFLFAKIIPESNELPFRISPYYKKKGEIFLDGYYIPKQVKINSGIKDKLADEVEFINGNPPPTLENRAINEKVCTEMWNRTGLDKIKVFGEDYFFPPVSSENEKEGGKLPFYLIPVKDHTIKSNRYGNLIIKNENKIYRPTQDIQ